MNAPQEDSRFVDDDPTGVRALLRSLPDPGPMPDELVSRIQQALAEEATAHTPVVDLGRYRATRRPTVRPLHWAAAAGLVAVAGGGLLATGAGSSLMAAFGSSQTAATVAARESRPAPSASGGAAAVDVPADQGSTSGGSGAATVDVLMSNTTWSRQDLTSAAAATLTLSGHRLRELASESPAIGPIGTPLGARDCASALGIASDQPIVVDLGTYDGQPAALIVSTAANGEHAAYVVGRHCRASDPQLRVGPATFSG